MDENSQFEEKSPNNINQNDEKVNSNAIDDSTATDKEMNLKYDSKRDVVKGGVLGTFIGLAVIVPGVSGSAMAIIFRLYERLLYALGNIFKKFKKCFRFLLPIGIGAVIGLVLGFFGVRALLNFMPFAIIALFAGLMLGAFPSVKDQLKGERPTTKRILLFILGLILPIVISAISIFATEGTVSLDNLQFYHYIIFLVLGYIIAITQLVPGLSATALLMAFGYFSSLINSISLSYWQSNPKIFIVYLCLIVGFVIGLFTVSKFMSKLIDRHRAPTFFTVAGLSLGSVVSMFFNPDIVAVYRSWDFSWSTWCDLGVGIVLFIVGIIVAYLFVRYERNHKS